MISLETHYRCLMCDAIGGSNYIHVYIYVFVFLYNLLLGCTSSWNFFLYPCGAWFIILLLCRYIYVFIIILMNIISMFTEICLYILYYLILGCTPSWGYYHIYFLYMIYSSTISTSALTYMHDIWLTLLCFNLMFSYYMNWNTYLCY